MNLPEKRFYTFFFSPSRFQKFKGFLSSFIFTDELFDGVHFTAQQHTVLKQLLNYASHEET